MAPLGKDPADKDNALKMFHQALAPLEPVAETIFAGKVDLDKLSIFQKMIWKKLDGPVGDFRDWDAIAGWAGGLPGKLGV